MKNKFLSIALAALMILASVVTPFATVKAAGTATLSTLNIHKLKYDTDLSEDKLIKNDGEEKTYDTSIVPYNPADYGEVGFTLYKFNTEKVLAKLQEESGNAKAVASKAAQDIEASIQSGLIEKIEVQEKKQEGLNPIQMQVTTKENEEYFLLVETTSPKTVVAKADPMLLTLPMQKVDGTGVNTEPHIYPKNKVDESSRELTFEKVIETSQGEKPTTSTFSNALFEVYTGKPGSGTKLMQDGNSVQLISGTDGKFKITGLKAGTNYYLVEVPNEKVDSILKADAKSKDKAYIASFYAQNDANNKYSFRLDENGNIYKITGWDGENPQTSKAQETKENPYNADNQKLPKIVNTVKSSASKKEKDLANSIGYSDVVGFEIKVNIPMGFAKDPNKTESIVITDTSTEGTKIDPDSFKIYDKNGKATKGTLNIEVVKDNQVKITIDKDSIKGTTDTTDIDLPMYIRYNVSLTKDFDVKANKTIKNTIDLKQKINENEYDEPNKPVEPDKPDTETPDKDKEVEVTVYTKKLKKVGLDLFSTNLAKTPLKDAEFILSRKIGDTVEYRKADPEKKYVWTTVKDDAVVVKSGEDGTFEFEGLAAKTADGTEIKYYAEEIKAPANYRLPSNEEDRKHEFTFTTDADVELEITNNRATDAPMTGYEKSVLTGGGLILLVLAAVVIGRRKKKEIAK